MATEDEWARARDRFARDDAELRTQGRTGYPGDGEVPSGGMGQGPLADQFVTLGQRLLAVPAEAGPIGVLERIVQAALALVPGADLVSVTLRSPDGQFHTPAETDPLATQADQVQYDAGTGPCLEATTADGLGVAASSHLASETRWAQFGPRVADIGLHAVLATGMFPGGDPPRLGALNYYSRTPGGLDDTDRDAALILAAHGATALNAAQTIETSQLKVTQMTTALETRDVIGQAKGVLMQRRGCTADEAFDVLRRASQDLNMKLRELAGVVASRHTEL